MDNLVRAFANTLVEYTERSQKCWTASPEECKRMMTMDFPLIQTFAMQNAIRSISRLPFDSKEAAAEIMEYLKTHPLTTAKSSASLQASPHCKKRNVI